MLVRIICLLIGYAFGLIQTSYIIGKMHGIDIREYGSGNAGTTNAMRTLGRKAGFMTFAGDMLKCLVATLVVRLIFGTSHADIVPVLCAYAAAGAILGHNFPFYMENRYFFSFSFSDASLPGVFRWKRKIQNRNTI